MARAWQLLVKASGDTKAAQSEIRALQKSTRNFGRGMSNMGRAMTLGITAPIVALGVVGAKKLGETQKALAQTEAVVKSTGGAANVTAKQISNMADAIAGKTGVDDDAIQSGENMLLTFTNIRNEVGKGNDVFNQATRIATDMSVALGTDVKSAALQMGKAINDPIKGVSKLQRVGVTFTDQQKDQIKAMSEAGDTMGAQKVMLAELNKEFGGSAAAFGTTLPGKISILKQNFEVLAMSIVENLVPAFESIMGFVQRLMDRFNGLSPSMRRIAAVGLVIAAALGPVLWIAGSMISAFAALIPVIAAISLPAIAVAAAVVGLGVALVIAYKKSETFRNIVNGAFGSVRTTVIQIVSALRATISQWVSWSKSMWAKFGSDIMSVAAPFLTAMAVYVSTWIANIRDVILVVLAVLRGDWSGAWDLLKGIVRRTLSAMVTVAENGGKAILAAVKAIGSGLVALGGRFLDAGRLLGRKIVDGVLQGVRDNAGGLAADIAAALGGPVGDAVMRAADAASGATGRSGKGGKSTEARARASAALRAAQLQAAIDADAFRSQQQAVVQYNKAVIAEKNARGTKGWQAAKQALRDASENLVQKNAARKESEAAARQAQKDADDAEVERIKVEADEAARNASDLARVNQQAADDLARDQRDAENFRRRSIGLKSVEEDAELVAANQIRAQYGLPPVASMSDIGKSAKELAADSSSGGSMDGPSAVQGSNWQPLAPTSTSALQAIQNAAQRALTGAGNTFNITSGDPEAVANRVAFIMGNRMLRSGGSF